MTHRSPDELLTAYQRDGFVFLPSLIPQALLHRLQAELPAVLNEEGPQRFFEQDGTTVRAVYGLHRKSGPWREASEASVLLRIARLLLGHAPYVFQWKINPKSTGTGEHWQWHRDFTFWQHADGMPAPDVLTAAVFLDDITQDNGPLRLIPGSHRVTTPHEQQQPAPRDLASHNGNDYAGLVSARLSYALPAETAEELSCTHGEFMATGGAGSVAFFHGNLVHGSAPNTSPHPRTLGLITYNTVRNAPPDHAGSRPEYFYRHRPDPLAETRPYGTP